MKKIKKMRTLAVFTGIIFVCYGAYRGEIDTVIAKAINICLECIGIG